MGNVRSLPAPATAPHAWEQHMDPDTRGYGCVVCTSRADDTPRATSGNR